ALLNGRLASWLARRAGVTYYIESLRVGCFRHDCDAEVDATGVRLAVPDSGGVEGHLDSLHWCRAHPLSVRGVRLGPGGRPDLLAVADVDSDLRTGTASIRNATLNLGPALQVQTGAIETAATGASTARDIRVTTASRTTISVERIAGSPVAYTRTSGRVAL